MFYNLLSRIENTQLKEGKDKIAVAEVKKCVKSNIVENLYCFLALIRRHIILKNKKIEMIKLSKYRRNYHIRKTFGKSNKLFWKYVYKYFWRLMRLETVINDMGYELSSHINKKIDKKEIELIYYKKFGEKDIFNLIRNDIINMNCEMIKVITDILKGEKNV